MRKYFSTRTIKPIFIFVLWSTVLFSLFSQTEVIENDPNEIIISRDLGDQIFSLNAGMFLPLFSHDPNDGSVEPLIGTFDDPRLSLGAIGTLRWGSFLNPVVNIGLDITWGFNVGPNGDLLSQFSPLQPRISAYLNSGVFEFPLHAAIGLNIISYKETTIFTPMVKLGGSVIWNATADWGFGLNLLYWWVPELYPADNAGGIGSDQNRFANYLEFSLSAIYNF